MKNNSALLQAFFPQEGPFNSPIHALYWREFKFINKSVSLLEYRSEFVFKKYAVINMSNRRFFAFYVQENIRFFIWGNRPLFFSQGNDLIRPNFIFISSDNRSTSFYGDCSPIVFYVSFNKNFAIFFCVMTLNTVDINNRICYKFNLTMLFAQFVSFSDKKCYEYINCNTDYGSKSYPLIGQSTLRHIFFRFFDFGWCARKNTIRNKDEYRYAYSYNKCVCTCVFAIQNFHDAELSSTKQGCLSQRCAA